MADEQTAMTADEMASQLVALDKAALESINTATVAFRDAINAALGTLPAVIGYDTKARPIAQSLLAQVSYPVDTLIPQALKTFQSVSS